MNQHFLMRILNLSFKRSAILYRKWFQIPLSYISNVTLHLMITYTQLQARVCVLIVYLLFETIIKLPLLKSIIWNQILPYVTPTENELNYNSMFVPVSYLTYSDTEKKTPLMTNKITFTIPTFNISPTFHTHTHIFPILPFLWVHFCIIFNQFT